jgi:hypothetical protein
MPECDQHPTSNPHLTQNAAGKKNRDSLLNTAPNQNSHLINRFNKSRKPTDPISNLETESAADSLSNAEESSCSDCVGAADIDSRSDVDRATDPDTFRSVCEHSKPSFHANKLEDGDEAAERNRPTSTSFEICECHFPRDWMTELLLSSVICDLSSRAI